MTSVAQHQGCCSDIADNEKGQTALHKAAAYKRSSICSLLVTAGASLLVADTEGRTARSLALAAGAEQSLLSYLENQASSCHHNTPQIFFFRLKYFYHITLESWRVM